MTYVKFLPEGKRVEGRIGESVLSAARRGNVDFLGPCAGRALCARCVLVVVQGAQSLSEVQADERSAIRDEELSHGRRLGCRSKITAEGEVVVFTPSQSRLGTSILLSDGTELHGRFDPVVRKVGILEGPPLYASAGLLGTDTKFTEQARASMAKLVHDGDTKGVFMIERRGEVLDVKGGGVLGLAVDVGTTKVAGYLVDLEDGKTLSVVTEVNPQIAYGEDVISRLAYAIQGGQAELQAKILECVNMLAARACKAAGVRLSDIYEYVIVGNTVMHHLFLKLEPKTIAYAPYAPASALSRDVSAGSCGLSGNAEARAYLPPLVSGYVGSDAVADVVATGLWEGEGPSLLVDIGTNTEIVLKKGEVSLACSAASGPAFEGAHITFGMRAATGAIDGIEVSGEGKPSYTVIGGTKPRGLAGSAVVDALAELHRVGIVDDRGAFVSGHASGRVRSGSLGFKEFVIAERNETEERVDITINQKDIREVQLAKAAIRAGIDVLMRRGGVAVDELKVMYVAGAFGFFLNPITARSLGLYPEVELDRVRMVGNTAVTGAKAMLVSGEARRTAEELAKKIRYVELATDPGFRKEFMDSISIPHASSTVRRPRAA